MADCNGLMIACRLAVKTAEYPQPIRHAISSASGVANIFRNCCHVLLNKLELRFGKWQRLQCTPYMPRTSIGNRVENKLNKNSISTASKIPVNSFWKKSLGNECLETCRRGFGKILNWSAFNWRCPHLIQKIISKGSVKSLLQKMVVLVLYRQL